MKVSIYVLQWYLYSYKKAIQHRNQRQPSPKRASISHSFPKRQIPFPNERRPQRVPEKVKKSQTV